MPPAWSNEERADVGRGIEICFQTMGAAEAPPMLLVMGIGSQMIAWPDGLCELLAGRGYRVIRFDNRDAGRSTWLSELGLPSVTEAWEKRLDDPPYLFTDMAADSAGLLDALEIESAHVVGASLGGFVAQTLAFEYPGRVRSLASVMSSTGSGRVGQPHPEALEVLMATPPREVDALVEFLVGARRVIGSTVIEPDEAWVRAMARRAFERGLNPAGTRRQLVASICSGDRTARLGEIAAPTVVLHGADDKLIDPSGGVATAEAIPGAELLVIEGWGHDLPPGVWPRLVDAIDANARRVAAVA